MEPKAIAAVVNDKEKFYIPGFIAYDAGKTLHR